MRPPDNEGRPGKGGPESRSTDPSIHPRADEGAFCRRCGEPFLRRAGECLGGHAQPEFVLVRRGGGRARWVPLSEVA